MLELSEWKTPASAYPRQLKNMVEVSDFTYDPGVYDCYRVAGWDYYRALKPLPVTSLIIEGRVWMVDDPPHWLMMKEHAKFMHGHVLVGGLGLGLIIHALQENPKVKKITVVEQHRGVIKMIAPLIPYDFEVVHADFWSTDIDADSVFLDILVGDNPGLVPVAMGQFIQLRRAYPEAPIRIHGFNNDYLSRMATDILAAEAHFMEKMPIAQKRALMA